MTALFLGVLGYVPLWGQNLNFTPDRPDGPAKIQSALWELATPGAAKPTRDLQDTVVVILVPHLGQASASIDTSSLAALGGKVLAQSKSLMRISVPASSLLAVSELPGVRFIRRPYRPHSQATISEGVSRIGALANHSAGVKGEGVKVAIIDGGFKGANKLSGDMPARWNYYDYTGEGIYAGDSVHGTACAEIIHDVAMEAELYLYKVGDLVDLENAKDRSIRDGIDVISHSMGWFGYGIGDGRGEACDIVNDAADNGILWVNAAGNDAQSHYDGPWFDSDDDGWHNFSGDDEVLAFEAEKGDEIRVFLTWNDWPDSRQNYDLYLDFVNSSGDLETVAESTDRQNVSGGDPVESIEIKVEKSGEYGISVRSEDARPRRLKIWSLNHDFEEFAVAENSIGSPADARGSMSVGAIYHGNWNAGRIEEYSSRGPTTDGRIKPDLVAPTGVSTASHAPYVFGGTSFAAPHVAGAAALIKSANPSYSRRQLWDALIEATVDIGDRGRDNDSGYGKLVLPIMKVQANRSPQITSVSPRQAQHNQTVTITGSNFGSSQGSSSVWVGSIRVSSFSSWSSTTIRFRVPTNMRSGNVTVRTAEGTSNAVRLEIMSGPYLSSVSPTRVKSGDRLTLTGSNFGRTRGSSYVLFTPNVWPTASSDYVSWSDTRIVVKVPARAQSGDVQVVTGTGSSGTKRIVVESASLPRITSVSPRQVQYNQVVTVTGNNFGSSRGSSTVRIGSIAIPSSALASWSNTRIRFRVPTNVRSGNVTVRTSAGTSNSIRLEITSPYLASVSPSRVKPGDRLTLTGANFRSSRGSGYVLFTPNVWPTSSSDYVTWSDSRIVVKVPAGAQSGEVKVITGGGTSGTKRIIVEGDEGDEGEVVESLPSTGLFGYSPPTVTKNPKSVKFGFDEKTNSSIACYFSAKEMSDGEVTIFLNEWSYSGIPESEDWTSWYLILDRADLRSGTNIIEFRNIFNENRTSSFHRWQLKAVWVGEPPSAKPVAGTRLLSELPNDLASGLGDPFPTPFNAEVTIPFVLAEAGPVRLVVYNLMGQQVRVLADGWLTAGAHRVRWDGRTAAGVEAASGVYWAVLQAGGAVQTTKLALIR